MKLLRTVGFESRGIKSELAGLNLKVFGSKESASVGLGVYIIAEICY